MITIVDYGLGNIRAFQNVYKKLNIPCEVAKTEEQLAQAEKIILIGVGAFDYAMQSLNDSGLRPVLENKVLQEKVPVLGICVGMQMMAMESEEGVLPGLGWVNARVKRLRIDEGAPLPHMGWNNLEPRREDAILKNLSQDSKFYFLHSYVVQCEDEMNVLTKTQYGEHFASIINSDNIFGMQCHPEKSHHNGIDFLENFARLP